MTPEERVEIIAANRSYAALIVCICVVGCLLLALGCFMYQTGVPYIARAITAALN